MSKDTPDLLDLPDEEIIKIYVEQLGMSEENARMMLAMQRGELSSDGDVVTVDDNGNPV